MNKVQYLHIRVGFSNSTPSSTGGITIGYKFNDEEAMLEGAYARCHSDDRYVKSIGNTIVNERIDNKADEYFSISYTDILSYVHDSLYEYLNTSRISLEFINSINDVSGKFINELVYEKVIEHINNLSILQN